MPASSHERSIMIGVPRMIGILGKRSPVQIDVTVIIHPNHYKLSTLAVEPFEGIRNEPYDELPTTTGRVDNVDMDLVFGEWKQFGHESMENEIVITLDVKARQYRHFIVPQIARWPIGNRWLLRDPA
jgi:hypothetical protein